MFWHLDTSTGTVGTCTATVGTYSDTLGTLIVTMVTCYTGMMDEFTGMVGTSTGRFILTHMFIKAILPFISFLEKFMLFGDSLYMSLPIPEIYLQNR